MLFPTDPRFCACCQLTAPRAPLAVWNRPGLDRKTRSMLNLAMLSALGKEHELKLHLNGSLNNGLTKEQIREVLLQVAIYCGVPAAVVAFRCAKEVFKERGV